MAEYIALADELAEESSKAGVEEINTFSQEWISKYINRFQMHQSRLEACKVYFGTPASLSMIDDQATSVMSQLQDIAVETKEFENIAHQSIKGGDFILPMDKLNEINKKIRKKMAKYGNKRADNAKDNINYNQAITTFQKILLEASRDIYTLREQVTGISEYFAFVYKGSSGGMYSTTVSVDQFFSSILNNNAFTAIFNFEQRSGGINQWSLRFDNAVTKSVLTQLANQQKATVSENPMTIKDEKGIEQDALDFYEARKGKKVNSWVKFDSLKPEEKATINDFIAAGLQVDRIADKYLVVRTAQTGFIAQEIFNSYVNGTNYKYSTDRVAWYKGADVDSKDGTKGYSVKNLIAGAPTLFAVSSVSKALREIVITLQRVQAKNLDGNSIKNILKQAVFGISQNIENQANKDIEEVLDILGV